ncbi:phosphogluconate dehydrogenase (NAD(+)-dependent, decarboxylating) [Aquihabitans sp. McL0605]|uniref:phosphogluconate dehydrogenase (NAD(+)-dependent, decarboxylating) n=1 Tax=Aquihabitans sp. McL0605 TaxID=3415671 RepID=UPI003CFAE79A
MKLGMIGLGKMGGNMAQRLTQHGHEVVGMDPAKPEAAAHTLEELIPLLAADGQPKVAWSMVPAGPITDGVITELGERLAPGDLVVDGGNSNYLDSIRHGEELAAKGIHFVDCGTSGGVWGLANGYALMVGGTAESVAIAQPLFDALAPPKGFAHAGPVGAGHYVKMVHNGVEYGLMQAYAEGYAILEASPLGIDVEAAIGSWQEGSVVRSWLLDLLIKALAETPDLDGIASVAADSGEGRWTVTEAVANGVSAPVISAALFARFTSQHREDDKTMKVISALRNQFGGHAIELEDPKGEVH